MNSVAAVIYYTNELISLMSVCIVNNLSTHFYQDKTNSDTRLMLAAPWLRKFKSCSNYVLELTHFELQELGFM